MEGGDVLTFCLWILISFDGFSNRWWKGEIKKEVESNFKFSISQLFVKIFEKKKKLL